jgi:type VI secretion system protein ImpA
MSAQFDGQALLEPISAAQPCGPNLEDIVLGELDRIRLFGQRQSLYPAASAENTDTSKEREPVRTPPNWEEVRERAAAGLEQSKDLRLLAYLGAALLWSDGGVPAFAQVLTTAAQWLEKYWAEVHPLVDDDAIARRNALNCFADPRAVIDRVTRVPLVQSRKHGRFALRDLQNAAAAATPANESRPEPGAIRDAFAEMPLDQLTGLAGSVASALDALARIDTTMRVEGGGPEVAPDFSQLTAQLASMRFLLQERLAEHPDAAAATEPGSPEQVGTTTALEVGAIRSRQDAVRALDAVADFFRRNEPSSPVPLFVERAKRLVSKDFLEVLADIAPDALPVARAAGGLKQDQ